MILTDRELRARGPELLDPFDPAAVQPASIDLRLGESFRVFRRHARSHIDLVGVPDADEISEAIEAKYLVVHPGEMVLGSTAERITVPGDLIMQLVGKSSLARLGLLPHVEAGFFDPGWDGVGTLEIANLGATPVVLRAGRWICQSRWMRVTEPPERLYGDRALRSHYQHSERAEGSRYEGS